MVKKHFLKKCSTYFQPEKCKLKLLLKFHLRVKAEWLRREKQGRKKQQMPMQIQGKKNGNLLLMRAQTGLTTMEISMNTQKKKKKTRKECLSLVFYYCKETP